MHRKDFFKALSFFSLSSIVAWNSVKNWSSGLDRSPRMPVLFLGHGSPMNAIEENEFVQGFRKIAINIPKPKAIICISAHWETEGSFITAMVSPRTIHDFGGFPKALFDVQYPAPGSPDLAQKVHEVVKSAKVGLDHQWGLDHGAWSVIKHLYPDADVPVLQFSLDRRKDPKYHYELAKELSSFRDRGILIIGSGNIVHNLGLLAFDKINQIGFAYDWALEAKETLNQCIVKGDHQALTYYSKLGNAIQKAIPSPEHYLPLLYTLALQNKDEPLQLFNDQALGGSLTMTSVQIGST